MVLQTAVAAGQLEFAINTSLGTISCAMNPMDVAGQVLKAAQSLQEATMAAGMCEEICRDIAETTVNQLPIVCELLRLGQLFPASQGVADLNRALLRCFKSVCDALHASRTAMYEYLQCNRLKRLRQAASVKELMAEKRMQLRHRFEDMRAYMQLATLLRSQQSAEQAQHTAVAVQELQQQVQELEGVCAAQPARVKLLAQAALARQTPDGQKVKVSKRVLSTVAMSPSGDRFATASHDHTAAVWDAATGTRMCELRGHGDLVECVAWSPDGSRVATASFDKTAAVWDAATGDRMHELRGHSSCVIAVAWSPDGSRVATASFDDTAAVWDALSGERMHELRGHSETVKSVAWSPDGTRVATGSRDTAAALWDAASGVCMHILREHRQAVMSVAWSPDGTKVATGSYDNKVAVWDPTTGTPVHDHELYDSGNDVIAVAWSPDGSRVAAVSSRGDPGCVWDVASGTCVFKLCRGDDHAPTAMKGVVSGAVKCVAWSPDGSRLVTGSTDMIAEVWDAADGACIRVLRGHTGTVSSVAWSPDGCTVYTASRDGTVRICNVAAHSRRMHGK